MPNFNLMHQFLPINNNVSSEDLRAELGSNYFSAVHAVGKLGPEVSSLFDSLFEELSGGKEGLDGFNIRGKEDLLKAKNQINSVLPKAKQFVNALNTNKSLVKWTNDLTLDDRRAINSFINNIKNVKDSITGSLSIHDVISSTQSSSSDMSTLTALSNKNTLGPLGITLRNGGYNDGIAGMSNTTMYTSPALFGNQGYREGSFGTLAHEFTHSLDASGIIRNDPELFYYLNDIVAEAKQTIPEKFSDHGPDFLNYAVDDKEVLARVVSNGMQGKPSPYKKGDKFYELLRKKGKN